MASSSSSFVQQKNQVYMSFRGEDSRSNFVSHLQAALERRGINTFIDYQLERGEKIFQALLKSIEESKISIIVLSKNYASSSWCLGELCKILECKDRCRQIVVPIFYHVEPSDVRKQTGSFAKAFAMHQVRFEYDTDMVKKWRDALTEVADLSGFLLGEESFEAMVIKNVVEHIYAELSRWTLVQPPVQQKDQVFLSFSEETRNNFTSHLDAALRHEGIDTFPDNKLKGVEEISLDLSRAIEESKISIVILSENYASSSRCLDELSKILECKERNKQIMVLPIFYNVNPSYVRLQKGSFEEAFAKYEGCYEDNIVKRWRAALIEVANLWGPDLHGDNKLEAEVIRDIVKSIWGNLYGDFSSDFKGLVGMESRIEKLKSLLDGMKSDGMKSDGVRIIGIWGMLGVGKTTTANVFFKHISSQFDASCFLADVREESMSKGLQCVRNELLSKVLKTDVSLDTPSIEGTFLGHWLRRIKVLIVLDDVSNSKQVEYLIGDGSCFGSGSTIIITSRDKAAFSAIANKIYTVEKLPFDQAFELFCQNASRGGCDIPVKGEPNLIEVVRYADGIPLALKILGYFLCSKSEAIRKDALRSLNTEIHRELRISYDELDDNERNVFLDVACFFEGEDINHVTNILEGCGFNTEIGLDVLISKSLITILNKNLQMNHLIQQIGREIVHQESEHPGKRSRLWIYEDIADVLSTNKGTETVEGIFLNMSNIKERLCINSEAFLQMHYLRFLKIYNPDSQEDCKVDLPVDGIDDLPDNLVYLHWQCSPLKSLPLKFRPRKLVELHMHYSHVIQLWEGTKKLSCLKWIDLSYSKWLKEIPDLSKAPNLERINLVGCTSLREIPSVAPSLPKLQAVYLSGCSNLENFPLLSWNVEELHLDGTAIEELPSEIQNFSRLIKLNMKNCRRLKNVPSIHCKLGSLEFLDLSGCSTLTNFPEISWNLKELHLDGTAIEELPSEIQNFSRLIKLNMKNCRRLKNVPSIHCKLESLEFLDLSRCSTLTNFPEISWNLKELLLNETRIEELPTSIESLGNLVTLNLKNCTSIKYLPSSISKLKSLECLDLSGCSNLTKIPGNVNVKNLYLEGTAIEEFPSNWVSQQTSAFWI